MPNENEREEIRSFIDGLVAEFASNREVLAQSINWDNLSLVHTTHDLVHSFVSIAVPKVTSEEFYFSRTAFLVYQSEIFALAHLSFYEALSSNYAAARMLLRSTLELLLKGTLWECLAHERYRENAAVLESRQVRIEGHRVSIIDWFHDVIAAAPKRRGEMEENSATVFDVITPLFETRKLGKVIPDTRTIINQLVAWDLLAPVEGAYETVHSLYSQLSSDVHVAPGSTDIGRRIIAGKGDIFRKTPMVGELNSFCELLQRVMTTGVALEENVLKPE